MANPAIDDDEIRDVEDSSLDGFDMDILDMSDDDLADMTNEQIAEASMKAGARIETQTESGSDAENEDDELDSPAAKVDDKAESDPAPEGEGALAPAVEDESDEGEDDPKNLDSEKNSESDTAKTKEAGDEKASKDELDTKVDYKQEYEKLLAPFKANGRQIQVDTVDDAITLMKMGANYNKKMAALKPTLKVVKMLEKHDLLDEAKLSHLIDIAAHDPSAITKLLKDAKLDPLDIDTDKSDYTPKDHAVSDSQYELDQVIDNIKDNESFPKTIDVISNQWDQESKKMALEDPRIITVIDEHIQSGVYDQIVSVMDKERLLGRLDKKADLVAYMEIGQALTSAGKLGNTQAAAPQAAGPSAEELAAKAARDKKRAAAASTQAAKKTAAPAILDPLSMSDEEFEKAAAQGLYR